ncbi:DUF4270 family protein [Mariniflexile sp.]|uniref:DUF4270 family protein n=1 Tax=Mariniflexile sp. TaxID=1979402 RepID=UPI0035620D45
MTIKQVITVPIFIIALCALFISCENDDETIPVGEDWVNLDTKVYFIDTLTIKSSTFKFDSITVSGTSKLLVGAYTDPIFGLTKSKSYVQLSNSIYTLDSKYTYDSIALILNYDSYFYNDTIPVQTINIYEVLDDIEPDDDATSYYNTTKITSTTTPIGTKRFLAKPTKDDSLHVTLSNTYGKTLFENIRDNKINNSDEFLKTYKGILIEPDNSNTAMLGFLKTSFIRVYYTDKSEVVTDSDYIDISFDETNSFHNISSEIEPTIFSSLTNQETFLPSTSTDNNVFMQAGTGMATRIDIPNLESLYDIPGTGIIIDANLKFKLKQNSATDNLYTDDNLNVYIIDHESNIVSALVDSQGSTVYATIESENSEFNITTYTIPVKYFLNLKLTDINGDKYYLAIYPSSFSESVNRYIFNGEAASKTIKSKLELTYAIYDK